LTLTSQAIEKLEDELDRKRTKPDQLFRLLAGPAGGLRMQLDEPTLDDAVLPNAGNAPASGCAIGTATPATTSASWISCVSDQGREGVE
jgi:hypothetical protein